MRLTHFYSMAFIAALLPVLGCDPATAPAVPTAPEVPTSNPPAGSTTGTLEVSVSTSGPEQDANGYFFSAQASSSHQSGRVAATDRIVLTGTQPGNVAVMLYGLAPNCNLTGPNPRAVNVQVGVTASISFVVDCVASGSLVVTTVTTGQDLDSDGYVMLDRARWPNASDAAHSWQSGVDLNLRLNGTSTASLVAPGNYIVSINGIAPNCELAIPAVQTITIVAGVETSLRLEVKCAAATLIAFVRGAGREEWLAENIANTDIYVLKSDGTGVTRLTSQAGADLNPAWSPDGRKIAFASDRAGNREIYVMNADGSEPVRLTNNAAADYLPAYSPDGTRIAFVSERDGNAEVYIMNSDGTNVLRLTSDATVDTDPEWSPDGSKIAFVRNGIVLMAADGSNLVRLTSGYGDRQPSWSPDARTIAFSSEDRGTYTEIYQMSADGSGIARTHGTGYDPAHPDWSPNGKQVAYDDRDCWDNGPCPRGILIGNVDGTWSTGIDDASEPAWRPRF